MLGQSVPHWTVVATTWNIAEAEIVRGRLEAEGVPAMLHQESIGSSFGITVGSLGEIKVFVRHEDYERAIAVLDEHVLGLVDDEDLLEDGDDGDDDDAG